ncbi:MULTISPECIES: DUF3757 domain-containing protein [Pseudomonas]|uniref:DUF3757 domain-containing protein n=1 Tax=Pseudomonas TaxID=286 RepID=UPI0006B65841|nr:DUF3757 domain-containing protein [Pseudomonas fuscovaginae]KPA97211.1 Protein of unknown function (DUF3757) [Pseudomonas fuscovaginae]
MQNRLATSLAVLTLALAGQAWAETPVLTATCPRAGDINQHPGSEGYTYDAKGPGGSQWTGENPETGIEYKVAFVSASYKASTQAVICDYEGDGDAGIRLTLKAVQDWKPSPDTDWKDGFCKSGETSRCGFSYSALITTQ